MKTIWPSVAYWKQAFKAHGATCVYCSEERKVDFSGTLDNYISSSIDHLIPTARGGANHPDNIVPACVICNFYKKDHLVPEPEFSQLTERRSDGSTYVRKESVPRYLELMRSIVQTQKEKKKAEFEAFRRYVEKG